MPRFCHDRQGAELSFYASPVTSTGVLSSNWRLASRRISGQKSENDQTYNIQKECQKEPEPTWVTLFHGPIHTPGKNCHDDADQDGEPKTSQKGRNYISSINERNKSSNKESQDQSQSYTRPRVHGFAPSS